MWWHLEMCPGDISLMSGRDTVHASPRNVHLGANGQPGGRLAKSGGAPVMGTSLLPLAFR
jgi:hypothetical protein